ncbi:MAG: redoxin domain-containing protein [Anaerolineales bacterium]|nr:redoxin domain-containing protein [Anaerolineales bacterium]
MAKRRSQRQRSHKLSTQTTLLLILLGVLGLIAFGLFRQNEPELEVDGTRQLAEAAEVGALAPDFELPTIEGKNRKLSDYRGQPLVLTFMHTW